MVILEVPHLYMFPISLNLNYKMSKKPSFEEQILGYLMYVSMSNEMLKNIEKNSK